MIHTKKITVKNRDVLVYLRSDGPYHSVTESVYSRSGTRINNHKYLNDYQSALEFFNAYNEDNANEFLNRRIKDDVK
jgi:hypothetical protein